jgi:hypothetical protein
LGVESFGIHWTGENVIRDWVEKPEGGRRLGRPRRIEEDNIKTDLQETG